MLGTPGVTYVDPNGNERYMDLLTRAYKDRIVYLQGKIDAEMSESISLQLLILEAEDANKPIKMIIHSRGGEIYSGNSIIDTMNKIKCPVHTIATGEVASMATTIFINGEKGNRIIMPHCRMLVHQPSGGAQGQASDIEINYKEIQYLKEQLEDEYVKLTKVSKKKMHEMMDRDTWLSAEEAVEKGLADKLA